MSGCDTVRHLLVEATHERLTRLFDGLPVDSPGFPVDVDLGLDTLRRQIDAGALAGRAERLDVLLVVGTRRRIGGVTRGDRALDAATVTLEALERALGQGVHGHTVAPFNSPWRTSRPGSYRCRRWYCRRGH